MFDYSGLVLIQKLRAQAGFAISSDVGLRPVKELQELRNGGVFICLRNGNYWPVFTVADRARTASMSVLGTAGLHLKVLVQ